MEVEVRAVPGLENCFASLPLALIHALESTYGGDPLPPVLALEIRARDGRRWRLAWSGSSSRSAAIEVAQQLAECISLPDCTQAQVKALANLPKATFVAIEPSTEDDWEVLELNSELAEEAILKQVGIVHEGMRFPLWLHGHITVTFLVVSTSPRNSVVQLVPGTKVAVAPKERKNRVDEYQDVQKKSLCEEQCTTKALLRVQAENRRDVQRFEFRGVELGVLLTSAVFMHPQTARKLSFDNLQLVTILPRLSKNETLQNSKDTTRRKGSMSPGNEENHGALSPEKEAYRHVVVRVIFSESVAKGHIMLPQSIRLFLRAAAHSWVYVKRYSIDQKKEIPSLKLSPCRFKLMGKNTALDSNGLDLLDTHTSIKSTNMTSRSDLFLSTNLADWSLHEKLLSSLSNGFLVNGDEEAASDNHTTLDKKFLVCLWLMGQLKAFASYTGVNVTSVFLSKQTLLHFEIKDQNITNKTNLRNKTKEKLLFDGLEKAGESALELLFLLTAKIEESPQDDVGNIYELGLSAKSKTGDCVHDLELVHERLEFSEPVFLDTVAESNINTKFKLMVSSLSWMEAAISDVINRLIVLLSPFSGNLLSTFDLPLPGHILIYGPAGSGKTSLAMAVAKYLQEHEEILAHIIFISCSKLALEKSQTIRESLVGYISEALVHSPSIIIFDDLDHVISFSSETEGSQPLNTVVALAKFLTDIIDEYGEKYRSSCGYGPIAFMASVQSLRNIPQSLSSSGRFDFHVQLPAPAASERGAILKHEIHKRVLQCSVDIVSDIASACDGYDAYDLRVSLGATVRLLYRDLGAWVHVIEIVSLQSRGELLVDRAVHAAVSRFLSSDMADKEHKKPTLIKEDFSQAMHEFVPVAMRGLTKAASEGGRSGWEDVGGLLDIRNAIQEMVELPSKFPSIFTQSPLRLRSNVLLYGPPGCGKTHIVGAAAAACSLRFISVKGPELLNKYIGASEQAVRDLFAKAAAAAPCLLFFDEFDSIAPKRGHDNTGVTDRVVNQLLTELDGVEALKGVFVFAATSRPDLLDAALLRPGRLDRLLFCGFPSWHERLDILKVLSKKLPLASDVNLDTIASMTDGFSGADLQALLSDAQLAAVHEVLESGDSDKAGRMPIINDGLLKSVASRARPSVSEAEKQRLNGIYSQFLDLKKSITAQSKDAKGKRATLA